MEETIVKQKGLVRYEVQVTDNLHFLYCVIRQKRYYGFLEQIVADMGLQSFAMIPIYKVWRKNCDLGSIRYKLVDDEIYGYLDDEEQTVIWSQEKKTDNH